MVIPTNRRLRESRRRAGVLRVWWILLLALGGASWPNLGSDGSWTEILEKYDIKISSLRPSNCGFHVAWSDLFREKFSGQPVKTISLTFDGKTIPGEIMIDKNGIEGGAVYAMSAHLRDALEIQKKITLYLDLKPSLTHEDLLEKLSKPRQNKSFSSWLQKALGIPPVSISLLREADMKVPEYNPEKLATLIKAVPITLTAAFPVEKSISTAGGVQLDELDENLMLKKLPGVFIAGEMLDWEAPTGGYLLQASLSSGVAAANGIKNYLSRV